MAEKTTNQYVDMSSSKNETLGKIEIAVEVLEVIAGIATQDVEGMASTKGNFASGVVERFGKKVHGKGVRIDFLENGLAIDIYGFVKTGFSVPSVAKAVQEQVKQAIWNMTNIQVAEVNVHITGIQFDNSKEQE